MRKAQLRKLATTDPAAFLRKIEGARNRELTARHLLLHRNEIETASEADLAALREYIEDHGWRSLYVTIGACIDCLSPQLFNMKKPRNSPLDPVRKIVSATSFLYGDDG